MDRPDCQRFPNCEGKHYSHEVCNGPKRQKGKGKPAEREVTVIRPSKSVPVGGSLEERIVSLEQIVDELLAGKRKRSAYMKAYMRDRRAKG